MKIIVLDSTAKSIKAVLASSVATSNPDFVVAYADTSDNTFSELSSDGQLNGTTDVTLVGAPASGVKRAIKSITIYNRDTAAVTVSIKFDNDGTQRILQRVQLVSGETWHSDDLSKLGPGGSDTQVQFNDVGTLAGNSNFTYNKTTSVLTLGANPVLTAGTANGVLYLNGSKSATTGSVLTFDGAQLGVNGITLGRGTGAVSTNTAVGASALAANTTGAQSAYFGWRSGFSNTTGDNNAAFGDSSFYSNTTGAGNTALGRASLYSNTTASNNTAVGYQAGYSNTTGTLNTSVGGLALYSNTTSNANTAVGYNALYNNTGEYNTAMGYNAGYGITSGSYNIAIGSGSSSVYAALRFNTTGSQNVAVGNGALGQNTTASNNTAVGYQAGYSNQTSGGAVFIGYQAGYGSVGISTTINYNTAIGYQAGYGLTSGYNNTLIGNGAGGAITSGYKNTILGAYTGNQGGLDIRTASNYIVLSDGDGNPRFWHNGSVAAINTTSGTLSSDLTIRNANGVSSGALSLAASSSGGGGASAIVMGNNDSGGTAGPNVIVSANRNIQIGRGNSFTDRTGGTVTTDLWVNEFGIGLQGNQPYSGIGLAFPATQSASSNANTLDDYEQGSWTPTLVTGASVTYTSQVGFYTKIGNVVTAWGTIEISAKASSAQELGIGGLPFASAGTFMSVGSLGRAYNPAGIAPATANGAFFSVEGQIAYPRQPSGNNNQFTPNDFANSGSIWIAVTYRAAD